MKKYNLFKIIMLCFFGYIILTWCIPTGTYADGTLTLGTTAPLGLFDIIRQPLSTIANFIHYGMIILVIGGLYGVMSKTGAYTKIVNAIADKFRSKKLLFVAIVSVLLTAVSAILGLNLLLFALMPFLVAVLMSMGLSKKNALLTSAAPIFFGIMTSIFTLEVSGYQKYFLGIEYNAISWIIKTVFALLLIALLVLYVYTAEKKKTVAEQVVAKKVKTVAAVKGKAKEIKGKITEEIKKEKSVEIPFLSKVTDKKKSAWPLIIICALSFILLAMGMFNWSFTFNFNGFGDMHTNIMDLGVGDFKILQNILGSVTALGTWDVYFLAIIFAMEALLIGWIYNLKFNEVLDAFVDGMKKMIAPAFYYVFASVIMISILTASANFVPTIVNRILELSKNFNVITTTLAGFVSSLFFNDYTQGLYVSYPLLADISKEYVPLAAFIYQVTQGIALFVLPTSAVLVAGLAYLEIPFKEWFKYIWKFILYIFLLGFAVIMVAGILI